VNVKWVYNFPRATFERTPGVHGDEATEVTAESAADEAVTGDLYASWGLTPQLRRYLYAHIGEAVAVEVER